ncbi:S1C family serine protease [Variovorax sp. PCZ-1]|uniref:S1C family serine protease n=1 Tax=Variovorax sp. PCZ-1 TaxID=2835533 RepID=UPI001BCFD161|nr:S1C family serine protease [Variovorax sp. PCZ-1]MBS7808193.1 trypsin-like peptidase domain-containing protein [Variovorax sp. PCZ-1]
MITSAHFSRLPTLFLAWCLMACSAAQAQSAQRPARSSQLENSVVKIFSTVRQPDLFRPWNKAAPNETTGSGVVIEGNRILTNAHVVNYASKVEVRAKEGGDKINAKVIAIARGIDLAVLELEDNSFFANRPVPQRASVLPEVKDEVLAYGYPFGGNSLSITKGIVSRIEYVSYNFPTQGLRIQVDAAINPGNSGGPVFAGDKMIGVAYSIISSAQNIGYIIPNEEVELFLNDITDGKYDGKPAIYDELQTLENPALRSFLKAERTVRGMVVQRPMSKEDSYPLKEWDIITRIGNTDIDNQGLVRLQGDVNVRFQYHVQKFAKNGKVPLTVVRQGKPLNIELPVMARRPRLVDTLDGSYPSYFIYGPMVFSRATWEFRSFFNNNAGSLNSFAFNAQPLVTRLADEPNAKREDLVVVSAPFFPHRLVSGYDNRFGSVVQSINDIPVRSLRHMAEILRDLKTELVVIKFDQQSAESIVLPHQKMLESTEEILNDNGIRFQASADLLDAWPLIKR